MNIKEYWIWKKNAYVQQRCCPSRQDEVLHLHFDHVSSIQDKLAECKMKTQSLLRVESKQCRSFSTRLNSFRVE